MRPIKDPINGPDDQDAELEILDQLLKQLFGTEDHLSETLSEELDLSGPDDSVESDQSVPEILQKNERIGRFRIVKCIGYGGFGVVYHVMDDVTGDELALKIPRNDRVNSQHVLKRFQREARLTKSLKHASIVQTVDTGLEDGFFYIASRYVAGINLKDWLKAYKAPVAQKLVVNWGIQLAEALQHAFSHGIVHRDLKPSNIIIPDPVKSDLFFEIEAPSPRPMITDYGLAFSLNEPISETSGSGLIVGSPNYMAPEQLLTGMNRVDIRADIYSLGLILAELLLGKPVRNFEHLVDLVNHLARGEKKAELGLLRKRLPIELYCILLKALETDPRNRYQTPVEFRDDLVRFSHGRVTQAQPMNRMQRVVKLVSDHPYPFSIIMIFVLFSLYFVSNRLIQHQTIVSKNRELTASNRSLESAKTELQSTLSQLRKAEENLVYRLYNSSIRLAYSEYRDGHWDATQDILDDTGRMTSSDGLPLKEFAWTQLQQMTMNRFSSHRISDFDMYLPSPLGAKARRTYESNKAFIESSKSLYGSLILHENNLAVKSSKGFIRLTDRFSVFYQDPNDQKNKLYDGESYMDVSDKMVIDPIKGRKFVAKPEIISLGSRDQLADMIRDISNKNHEGDVNLPFSTDYLKPVFSNDSRSVLGMVQVVISGKNRYFWVVYDFETNKVYDPGFEFHPEGQAPGFYSGCYFSQSGRQVLVFDSVSKRVNLHDLDAGLTRPVLSWLPEQEKSIPLVILFDNAKDRLLISDSKNRLSAWKVNAEAAFAEYPRIITTLGEISIMPDGRVAINRRFSNRVWVWDIDSQTRLNQQFDLSDEVWSLEFDDAEKHLVGTGDNNQTVIWNLEKGNSIKLEPHDSLVTCGRFSPNQRLFAACDYSGFVKVWDTSSWKPVKEISVGNRKLRRLAWAPDNHTIMAVGNDNFIATIDISDTKGVNSFSRLTNEIRDRKVHDIIYSDRNKAFYVSAINPDEILCISWPEYEIKTSAINQKPKKLSLDMDESLLAVGYENYGFGILKLDENRMLINNSGELNAGLVDAVAFLKNQRNLVTSGGDNRITIYETKNWEPVGTINDHQAVVNEIAVSRSGKYIASGDMNGQVIVRRTNLKE